MDRVSSTGYQIISGGRRTFQNKNLGAAIQGTTFDQVWFAGAQECIIGVYEQLGITPTDQTLGNVDLQLLQAIRRIAAGNSNGGAVLTASASVLTADNAGLVLINASSGGQVITLPLVASSGGQMLEFQFVRLDSTGNTVTLGVTGSDTTFPTGLGPFISLPPGGALSLKGDGISRWVDPGAAIAQQNPYFNVSQSLSTTTANNTSYTLISQAVTMPATGRTGGFRLKIRGTLGGTSTAQMQQNLQLSVTDGTTTQAGAEWLAYTTTSSVAAGVESGFDFPTVYAPGASITVTLKVATLGGGASPGQLAMTGAAMTIRVEDA